MDSHRNVKLDFSPKWFKKKLLMMWMMIHFFFLEGSEHMLQSVTHVCEAKNVTTF